MLQDNPKFGELLVQLQKGGKEALLCRQHGHIALGGDLSVQVKDYALTLHLRKYGIELRVVDDTSRGVGSYTRRVTLNTGDTALLGIDDGFRRNSLVEVKRHEEIYVGLNGL